MPPQPFLNLGRYRRVLFRCCLGKARNRPREPNAPAPAATQAAGAFVFHVHTPAVGNRAPTARAVE